MQEAELEKKEAEKIQHEIDSLEQPDTDNIQ